MAKQMLLFLTVLGTILVSNIFCYEQVRLVPCAPGVDRAPHDEACGSKNPCDVTSCPLSKDAICKINTCGGICEAVYYHRNTGRSVECTDSHATENQNIHALETAYMIDYSQDCGKNGCNDAGLVRNGLCPYACGQGGYCCRPGHLGCVKELRDVITTPYHTCVKYKTACPRKEHSQCSEFIERESCLHKWSVRNCKISCGYCYKTTIMYRDTLRNDMKKVGSSLDILESLFARSEPQGDQPPASRGLSKCQIESRPNPRVADAFKPECKSDGSYAEKQCYNAFNKNCWCVDTQTGTEIPNTKRWGNDMYSLNCAINRDTLRNDMKKVGSSLDILESLFARSETQGDQPPASRD